MQKKKMQIKLGEINMAFQNSGTELLSWFRYERKLWGSSR